MARRTVINRYRGVHGHWERAACIDPSVCVSKRMAGGLVAKQVVPATFSRSALFEKMRDFEPALFNGVPVWINEERAGSLAESDILEAIQAGLPPNKRARVRQAGAIRYMSIAGVIHKWLRANAVINVPDLNYVGTRFDKRLDTSAMNVFSLLSRGPYEFQSQDSLVMSAAGALADSHSDDHAGSNHCFIGRKLWLMWDTLEGIEHGLEDAERCSVRTRARFDMRSFLMLRSSRWLVIGPGQTMFIPVNLTHKVITLQRYLGLGSFHLSFPSLIDSMIHWAKVPPYWATGFSSVRRNRMRNLIRHAVRTMRYLSTATHIERTRWGIPQLRERVRRLRASDESRAPMWGEASLQYLVRALDDLMER